MINEINPESTAAKRIYLLMQSKNIRTVYELSKFTKVSFNTLNGIIRLGRLPQESTIKKICTAFEIDLKDFYNIPVDGNKLDLKLDTDNKKMEYGTLYKFFARNINDPHLQQILEQVQKMDVEDMKLLIASIKLIVKEEEIFNGINKNK